MELHQVETSLSPVPAKRLKPNRPPPKPFPPPRRRELWLGQIFGAFIAIFSVRPARELYREIGPGFPPELVERKEARTSF